MIPGRGRAIPSDTDDRQRAAERAATGSSSSVTRGVREPANDVIASALARPEPSSRQ